MDFEINDSFLRICGEINYFIRDVACDIKNLFRMVFYKQNTLKNEKIRINKTKFTSNS